MEIIKVDTKHGPLRLYLDIQKQRKSKSCPPRPSILIPVKVGRNITEVYAGVQGIFGPEREHK